MQQLEDVYDLSQLSFSRFENQFLKVLFSVADLEEKLKKKLGNFKIVLKKLFLKFYFP